MPKESEDILKDFQLRVCNGEVKTFFDFVLAHLVFRYVSPKRCDFQKQLSFRQIHNRFPINRCPEFFHQEFTCVAAEPH